MPATKLVGLKTPCDWQVTECVKSIGGSGGNFCTQYIVENIGDGRKAFLKAMDLKTVASKSLQEIVAQIHLYLFEQNILEYCKINSLSNVVVPLSHGEIAVNGFPQPLNRVFFIVFDLADANLRQFYINRNDFNWLDFFKSVKNVCQGVHQLHASGIAHQDIKPSNVLHFPDGVSRIGDLGRVTDAKGNSPFSNESFTGDFTYAPVEFYFGIKINEFSDRYLSDIYEVGSLVYNTIMGTSLTHAIFAEAEKIDNSLFNASYRDCLPTIYSAYVTILQRMRSEACKVFGDKISEDIAFIVHEMCHPDFQLRGSPKYTNKILRVDMQRYISKFSSVIRLILIAGIK